MLLYLNWSVLKPIIVHGGGKEISRWGDEKRHDAKICQRSESDRQNRRWKLPKWFLNNVNKSLVQLVGRVWACLVSASAAQRRRTCSKVKKKYSDGQDIGYVGEITDVNPKILYDLLEKDFLPVVCPIGLDDHFESYNINADDAACAIAKAMQAEKLAFLTDIEGVYKDPSDSSTLISEMTIDEARQLLSGGFIGGGMLPKLNNCIDAIEGGVSRVHILDGRILHCLLLEIFTNKGIGTAILAKDESRCYHENE